MFEVICCSTYLFSAFYKEFIAKLYELNYVSLREVCPLGL